MIEILVIYMRLLGQFQTFYSFVFLQKYFTHTKSIKKLNKRLLLYAQKSIKYMKSIKTSSIVNEVIRGNFTGTKSTKRIKNIKSIKSTKSTKSTKRIKNIKSIKSIKTLNKRLTLRCFLYVCKA